MKQPSTAGAQGMAADLPFCELPLTLIPEATPLPEAVNSCLEMDATCTFFHPNSRLDPDVSHVISELQLTYIAPA